MSSISGVVQRLLVGAGGDDRAVVAADARAAGRWTQTGEDVRGAEEPVDEVEDLSTRPPAGRALQTALMTSRSAEGARLRGQAVGAGQPPVELLGLRAVRVRAARCGPGPAEDGGEGVGVEAEGLGPVPPPRQQAVGVEPWRPWRLRVA